MITKIRIAIALATSVGSLLFLAAPANAAPSDSNSPGTQNTANGLQKDCTITDLIAGNYHCLGAQG